MSPLEAAQDVLGDLGVEQGATSFDVAHRRLERDFPGSAVIRLEMDGWRISERGD
jgi:hypothetical protein